MMKRGAVWGLSICLIVIAVALSACTRKGGTPTEVTKAIAVLYPTEGSKVKGVVSFERTRQGVTVSATIEGLAPGPHGFHVHEYGDCTSPDANSAGGHFNPLDMPHAAPTADQRHEGDLGNVEAPKSGPAKVEFVDKMLALEGPGSIIGRAVVVHAQADDLKTQPTGASGARVACGVIGIAK
jgi:superoxide dismutase, Cu-Zn family